MYGGNEVAALVGVADVDRLHVHGEAPISESIVHPLPSLDKVDKFTGEDLRCRLFTIHCWNSTKLA